MFFGQQAHLDQRFDDARAAFAYCIESSNRAAQLVGYLDLIKLDLKAEQSEAAIAAFTGLCEHYPPNEARLLDFAMLAIQSWQPKPGRHIYDYALQSGQVLDPEWKKAVAAIEIIEANVDNRSSFEISNCY